MGIDQRAGQSLGPLVGLHPTGFVPHLEVGPRRDHGLEVFGVIAVLGVLGPEKVPGRPHLGDGLHGQGGVIDGHRLEHGRDHVQQVGVDDHLLERSQQATL